MSVKSAAMKILFGSLGHNTMDGQLLYTANYDRQNYFIKIKRLDYLVEKFGHCNLSNPFNYPKT